jgi:hypothetical protein
LAYHVRSCIAVRQVEPSHIQKMFDGSVPSRDMNLDGILSEDGSVTGAVTEGFLFFFAVSLLVFVMRESHVELSKIIVL